MRDRAISSKFSTRRVCKEGTLCNFQKNFPLPKNGGHFEFSNFCQKWQNTKLLLSPFCIFGFLPKMAKHKIASISLTVRDRAISSQFSTHRVCKEGTPCNFQKIFPSPKMAAILNFWIFAKKMAKHKLAFISLTMRESNFIEIFDPQGISGIYSFQFSKNFPLPKNGGHFEFSNFCQKWQNTKLLLSP